MNLYTIGYGGRTPSEFLALLRANSAQTLVDVRLRPDRASMGIWVKAKTPDKGIEKLLNDAGIGYRSLVELGNPFMELEDWPERYQELMEQSGELLTRRLRDIAGPYCLMCAEKRPEECHRRIIAEYLTKTTGARVSHLV